MEAFTLNNLNFSYPQSAGGALKNLSFSVEAGAFVLLCGETGSGKSTLLRLLKPSLRPTGQISGDLLYRQKTLLAPENTPADLEIGFVAQRPEEQIVTDKVWHELAFGPENLGLSPAEIRLRVAEIASFFGIGHWFDRETASLSGGQKQLLNLASVLTMRPKVLLLDEPCAYLDPIAAGEFLTALTRLNREMGITVLIAEHRIEELLPVCDKLLLLEHGETLHFDTPREVLRALPKDNPFYESLPCSAQLFRLSEAQTGHCPLTVREGKVFLRENFDDRLRALEENDTSPTEDTPALEFSHVFLRYEKNAPDVLRDFSLRVNRGEIFCLLGANACGKTTALHAAAGLQKPYAGTIRVFSKPLKEYRDRSLYRNCLALLPQDVQTVFLKNTVREELEEAGEALSSLPFDLSLLSERHPYDLSGGEQQLCALAKTLSLHPKLLLLDEPTKGLDAARRNALAKILLSLKQQGLSVVFVTHDAEFAALCADRCALLFSGEVVSVCNTADFFTQNEYYTTQASRISRGYYERTVTTESLTALCLENGRKEPPKCE